MFMPWCLRVRNVVFRCAVVSLWFTVHVETER